MVLDLLNANKLLSELEDGRQVVDLDSNKRVVITKSDGSSLYITRDIAAALDRFQNFRLNSPATEFKEHDGQILHLSNSSQVFPP